MRLAAIATALVVAGCAQHRAAPPDPIVARVVSAHHGECPAASRRVFAHRAAALFAHSLPYDLFHCMSWTEAQLLRGGCGSRRPQYNTVFITFKTRQPVRFEQDGYVEVAHVRTFGSTWEGNRAILYFTGADFPKIPLPPGTKPYTGPARYGLFGVDGDPLRLEEGECPTAERNGVTAERWQSGLMQRS